MVINVYINALSRLKGLRRFIWITPSGNWSRVTGWMRWILRRGYKSGEVTGASTGCLFTQWLKDSEASVWKTTALFFYLMCGSFNSSPSSVFCSPLRELYSLKVSAWKASHSSQCNPNLEKSNGNVKRCPSGTGKSLPLASSALLWRAVDLYGTCGCVLLFGITHVSILFFYVLTSSTKPQNRLFFSGRGMQL